MEKSRSAGTPAFFIFGYMVSAILKTRVSPQARSQMLKGEGARGEKPTVADTLTGGLAPAHVPRRDATRSNLL